MWLCVPEISAFGRASQKDCQVKTSLDSPISNSKGSLGCPVSKSEASLGSLSSKSEASLGSPVKSETSLKF